MAEIEHILDGVPCNPVNRREIDYVFDFSARRHRSVELSISALEFVAEDYDRIKTFRNTFGDYVAMPYTISFPSGLNIDYMLVFSDESAIFRTRSCSIPIVKYRDTDNFFDNAEGLSFGSITWAASDFHDIDYVVVSETSFLYFISLSIATFSLAQELAKAVQSIAEGITDLIMAVQLGLGAISAIIVAAIKLLARIAYAIFIVIALIKLVTEILNIIFPKIRQFKGIKLKRLIEKGCQHMGYTLQSTMLDAISNAVICPTPLKAKNPTLWKQLFQPLSLAYTHGYPSARDTVQFLGQAIAFLENELNAQVRIENNNVVRIELEEWYEQAAVSQLNEAFNLQSELQDEGTINADEIFKALTTVWQTDPSDINTYDDSKKSLYEVRSVIQSNTPLDYQTIRGNKSVNIPFARGTRKGSLTFAEEAAKVFAKAIDFFCGTSFSSQIEARKDVMQVSNQYFSVTKLLYMSGSKLVTNQNDYLGAEKIAQTYWAAKFIENNQKDRKKGMPLEMTEGEFFALGANNYVTLNNGDGIKLTRISWNDYTNISEIDFEKKKPSINEATKVIHAG